MRHVYLLFVILLLSSTVSAEEPTQMLPLSSEKLTQPIKLTGHCSGVEIVEWRVSGPNSEMTKENIEMLNIICQYSLFKFPEFIKNKGFKMTNSEVFKTNISLIPVGTEKRSLNDSEFRFSNRSLLLDNNGNKTIIFGYFQRAVNHIYVRNDVADNYKVVFAHEIFHAASTYYGVYYQQGPRKADSEEFLAQEFTEYIGLGI